MSESIKKQKGQHGGKRKGTGAKKKFLVPAPFRFELEQEDLNKFKEMCGKGNASNTLVAFIKKFINSKD